MNKELRIYRLTDKILHYSEGKIDYNTALNKATQYCNNNKKSIFSFSHVGDDSAAWTIARKLMC